MCVSTWEWALHVFVGDVALVGKIVSGNSEPRPESFPLSLHSSTWFQEPPTPKHEQSMGGGAVLCLVSHFNTGGTPEPVMRKSQECRAFPVWCAGPGTSKVQRECRAAEGWLPPLLISVASTSTPAKLGSCMTTVCVSHIHVCFGRPLYTRTLWNPWLNRDEGGVCVGVVGMVMVNSRQRVFRMFP